MAVQLKAKKRKGQTILYLIQQKSMSEVLYNHFGTRKTHPDFFFLQEEKKKGKA